MNSIDAAAAAAAAAAAPSIGRRHRRRRRSSKVHVQAPDLTIVVSGECFLHYSFLLRRSCPRISRMLAADPTMTTIVIRNKSPKEWPMVASFLKPSQEATVTGDNVHILLPWFKDLEMDELLKQCDDVCARMVDTHHVNQLACGAFSEEASSHSSGSASSSSRSSSLSSCLEASPIDLEWAVEIMRCLETMKLAQEYGLDRTLLAGLRAVADYVQLNPHVMAWPEFFESIKPFLSMDPLWSVCIEDNLPKGFVAPATPATDSLEHRLIIIENPSMAEFLRFDVANRC